MAATGLCETELIKTQATGDSGRGRGEGSSQLAIAQAKLGVVETGVKRKQGAGAPRDECHQ